MKILAVIVMIVAAGGFVACKHSDETSNTNALASKGSQWSSKTIPVCFLPQETNDAAQRRYIKDAINKEYKRAGFTFTGWGACQGSPDGTIKIRISPENSRARGFGRPTGDQDWSMNLRSFNPDYRNLHRGEQWVYKCYDGNREACEINDALHEMGHVLGMHHENAGFQNGYANPCDGAIPEGLEESQVEKTKYDSKSIMNYCINIDDKINNRIPTLSEQDVKFLIDFYSEVGTETGNGGAEPDAFGDPLGPKPSESTVVESEPSGNCEDSGKKQAPNGECILIRDYNHCYDKKPDWTGRCKGWGFDSYNAADESDNELGENRCTSNNQCGLGRTCSVWGWCTGDGDNVSSNECPTGQRQAPSTDCISLTDYNHCNAKATDWTGRCKVWKFPGY